MAVSTIDWRPCEKCGVMTAPCACTRVPKGSEAAEIVAAIRKEKATLYDELDLFNDPLDSLADWIESRWGGGREGETD